MEFGYPQVNWLLLGVFPLLVWFLVWSWRRKQRLLNQWVAPRLREILTVGVSPLRRKVRLTLLTLAVVLLFLTLARPRWGLTWEEARQRGLDIIVAIDTSRSMLAEDVRPNRLARAKLAALDLMKLARSDRLGLIAFAGTAFLQCPLTVDDSAFRQSIDALNPGIMPQGGTALADAIRTATSAFKDEGDNHRILVLFTDGEDHDGQAVAAAEAAAKDGLRIFTVGIGTPAGELLAQTNDKGQRSFVKDDSGAVVKSRLNEELLQQIAGAAQGFYLPLRGADVMETLYEKGLAPLPKSEFAAKLISRYHDRFQWPLAVAIVLAAIECLIPDRRRAAAPAAPPPTAANATALLGLFVLSLASTGVQASPRKAANDYQQGRYEDSLQEYERLLERSRDNPQLQYNAGGAAYRARNYDQAIRHFSASVLSPDLPIQQKSYYNLGNSQFRSGEQAEDPQSKQTAWEQALKSFESAAKLDPKDQQAKDNLEFVKRKLEELKQQQQQQQQSSNQDQKQDKDQDQKKDENQKDSKQDASKDKQSDDQKNQESQKSKPQPNQEQKDPKDQQASKQPQPQDKSEEPKPNPQQANSGQPQPKDEPKDGQTDPAQAENATPVGQMTPQQAQQMLEAQKGEERVFLFVPPEKQSAKSRSFKDW